MGMDGNCFFRTISKEILGTECHHSEIRQLICNFVESHPVTFSSWFYGTNFIDHITSMPQDKVWAEAVELIATASYFNTPYLGIHKMLSCWWFLEVDKN